MRHPAKVMVEKCYILAIYSNTSSPYISLSVLQASLLHSGLHWQCLDPIGNLNTGIMENYRLATEIEGLQSLLGERSM